MSYTCRDKPDLYDSRTGIRQMYRDSRRSSIFRLWSILVICFVFAVIVSGCGAADKEEITSSDQLNRHGMKIGVPIATPEEAFIKNDFPEAEIIPYNDDQLGFKDVSIGRIDAFVHGIVYMESALENGTKGVRILDEVYMEDKVAVGYSDKSEIPDLESKLNEFIAEIKEDGTLEDMKERWTEQGIDEMPEIELPEDPEYHLKVGTTGILKPFSYYDGTELTGHDIELAYRFAAWLNADITFKIYDFGGVIAACETGDVDCVMTNLYITPERAEAIDFSDPLSVTEVGFMVRDTSADAGGSFLNELKSGFEKTFIRSDRWKLFVEGVGVTLLITASSILLGTLLGFAVYMICRRGGRISNTVTRFCVWLIQGMPVVVLLMILYYLIFSTVEISGTLVAIIGFTLLFGAAVYSMLKTGIATVDYGQTEAAYSLGYTDNAAFYRIVLPQALPVIMPGYMVEISSLLKATAVVGYIAVQDLTKMGDIVRSRTYEAFFPLIAVAVIYFILAAILKAAAKRLRKRLGRRNNKTVN